MPSWRAVNLCAKSTLVPMVGFFSLGKWIFLDMNVDEFFVVFLPRVCTLVPMVRGREEGSGDWWGGRAREGSRESDRERESAHARERG